METRHATNETLRRDAGQQMLYVLSALGLMDTEGGHAAMIEALKGARKSDLWAIVDTLRAIKTAVRVNIEDSKTSEDYIKEARQDKIRNRTAADVPRRDRIQNDRRGGN